MKIAELLLDYNKMSLVVVYAFYGWTLQLCMGQITEKNQAWGRGI